MPVLGLTKLQAINEIARARGEPAFSALDPQGSEGESEQANVEGILNTETRRVLEQEEWPESIDYAFQLTSSGTSGQQKINAPPNTLWIRGAAHNQYRNVTLRGDLLWDLNRHTDTFPDGTSVYVDICRLLPFEHLSPTLKDHIVARARKIYARPMVSDTENQGLREEALEQDVSARRYGPQTERRPVITGPLAGRFAPDEPRRS